jgi:hypothetical protein
MHRQNSYAPRGKRGTGRREPVKKVKLSVYLPCIAAITIYLLEC